MQDKSGKASEATTLAKPEEFPSGHHFHACSIDHEAVVRALQDTRAMLASSGGPNTALSRVEELVSAVPATATMLSTLLTAVNHGLSVCAQVEPTSDVTPVLTSLFKTAYSQLKTGLKAINSLPTDSTYLIDVVTALVSVGTTALTFDPSILALCWRELGAHLSKVHSQSSTAALMVVRELCNAVETKFRECEALEGKQFKLVSFLGNLLRKAVQETHEIVGVSSVVLPCLLTVLSQVYPLPVQEQALLMLEAVMMRMAHNEEFLRSLLECSVGDQQALGHVLCLCSLVTALPHLEARLVELCVDKVSSSVEAVNTCRLLDCLFHSLTYLYVEVQLPIRMRGVAAQGRSSRMVTLSDYVTVHVCSLCTLTPLHYLPQLERALFRGVLSPVSTISLLSSDVWVFHVRRCSTAAKTELCHLLLKLTQSGNSPPVLRSLLYRVLSLLPQSSQIVMGMGDAVRTGDAVRKGDAVRIGDKEELVEHILDRLSGDVSDTEWSQCVTLLSRLPISFVQFNEVLVDGKNCLSEAKEVAVCTFLRCHVPHISQSSASVVICFQYLFTSGSWLVHQLSLEAFREFARVSENTELLESCVPEGYTQPLVEFLHKRPCGEWSMSQVQAALRAQAGFSAVFTLTKNWKQLTQNNPFFTR